MFRLLFFVGVGLVVGGIIVMVVGPPGAGVWALPVGLTLAILCGTFVLIGKSLRGVHLPSNEVIAAARNAGRLGVARVDALRQTGTQINDQPLCEIDLTVQPRSGAAFRTSLREIVPITQIPAVQPGARRVVANLTVEGPELALLPDDASGDPWRDIEIPDAAHAGPVRVGGGGVIRADGTRRGPIIGMGKRGRPLRIALFAVAAAVAAVAVVLPYNVAVLQTVSALQQGRLHPDYRDPEPLGQAITALQEAIGHDQLISAIVTDEFVIVEAPLAPGENATDRWIYRGGGVTHDGAASIQPETPLEAFSITDVDWDRLAPAAKRASIEAGIEAIDDLSFSVGRSTDSDTSSETFGRAVGPVVVNFSVSDDYRSVSFRMNGDGSGFETLGG
ncbi:hypothetical protein [Leucobacter musarum]|uniref:hypothetical protein n=1 Tax=Leucobacter musarum TaxID=1930747 RepID=UPI0006A7CB78|nr:hypothetical protein [Leucobacter musarum]